MEHLSPRARFDALAAVLKLDEAAVDAIRHSINTLLPSLRELAGMWDATMRSDAAGEVFGALSKQQREDLQGRLATFVMRTINCAFDDDFCDYADEFARDKSVPARLIPIALSVAFEFVARILATKVEDHIRRAEMLAAWNRLITVLREFARP